MCLRYYSMNKNTFKLENCLFFNRLRELRILIFSQLNINSLNVFQAVDICTHVLIEITTDTDEFINIKLSNIPKEWY